MQATRRANYSLDLLHAQLILTINTDNGVEVDIQSIFHELLGHFMGLVREFELSLDQPSADGTTLYNMYDGEVDGIRYVWAFDLFRLPASMKNIETSNKVSELIAYWLDRLFSSSYVMHPVPS